MDFVIFLYKYEGEFGFLVWMHLSIARVWALFLVSNLHNPTMPCCFYADSFIYLS